MCGAAALCGPLVSCDVSVKRGATESPGTSPAMLRQAFAPVRLQVHPLSRIRRDRGSGDMRIEAHVELIDAFDHLTKGLGEFRFEIETLERDAVRLPDGSRLIWRIPVDTPERASAPFDPLTRTYRFVLTELAPGFDGESVVLKTTFSPLDGSRLYGERTVTIDPRDP